MAIPRFFPGSVITVFITITATMIVTMVLLVSPPVQAVGKFSHGNAADAPSCRSCHTGLMHGNANGRFTDECATCHSTSEPDRLIKTGGEAENMEEDASQFTNVRKLQGDMYYSPSRLGPEPNEMVLIPAGDFIMGTDNRLPDEGPEHMVTLPAYYIDKYEVTNLQYKKFIDDTDRKSPSHFRNRTYPEGKADHPVTYVNWFDADAYCSWAGKRLPTDAEWEKAARGEHGRIFPWGNEFDINNANTPVRWEALETEGDTTPVGSFPAGASPYGLYDMSGNVWEWTSSWYLPYPGNQHKTENYGETYKVLKGGSWWDCSFYKCGISAPSYNRAFFLQGTRNNSFGFRCAKDHE